jgi:predicted PurR-regulated permease PerM
MFYSQEIPTTEKFFPGPRTYQIHGAHRLCFCYVESMNKYFRWGLISICTLAFIIIFLPFYTEILTAGVFAFALDPLLKKLPKSKFIQKSSIYFKHKQWVAISLSGLIILIVFPIIFVIYSLISTVNKITAAGFTNSEYYKDVVNLKSVVLQHAQAVLRALNLERKVDLTTLGNDFLDHLGTLIGGLSGRFLSHLPELFLSTFVLAEHRQLRAIMVRARLISLDSLNELAAIFQKSCATILLASVIIGTIQAVIMSTGSALLDIGDYSVVFIVTFFLSFIPVLGGPPVALFMVLLSLVEMKFGAAITFLCLAVVIATVDNVIRPYLSGGEEVHPVVVLIGLIGATLIFGFPGLFLGPVITSVTTKIYSTYILGDTA